MRSIFIVGLCGCIFSSCSTKKNTVVSRAYHNLTSRYNGYYWAGESLKEGIEKIETAHKDDYTRLLPVFIYADSKEAKSTYAEMDRTILKSSTVIQRHAITDKKDKEIVGAVKWIDDNYMLVGKGQFYKNDYLTAVETFEYVAKTYIKDINQYNAMLWMIRCNNELGNFSMVEPIIDMIKGNEDFPKELRAEYAAVSADYYLKRENYHEATKELTKAAAYTRKKKARSRYTFILAQLYEKEGNAKKASVYFNQVIKMHPDYDMAFNAKINMAKLYDAEYGDSKKIKRDFRKMLRDEKNEEYRDQIYFALAQIEKKEKNIPKAIDYLKLSVKTSTVNKNQKALSYLELGDIYFDVPDYKNAQVNYDSTVAFIDKNYPNYEQIVNKQKSLTELVKNLDIISLEDSLQRLAKLSEKERDKIIRGIIVQVEEDELKKEEEKLNQKNNNSSQNSQSFGNDNQQQGGLPQFYNPSTVIAGIAEFTKRWGDRKLEDNWRRNFKETITTQSENNSSADTTGKKNNSPKGISPNKTKEYYLKQIPLTEEQLQKSNEKIINAYYEAGNIYREQILNNEKSVETFEELLKRYPENPNRLSTYYQLYRLYIAMKDKEKADYYKNIILTKYPDTEYAKLIKMPDYAKRNKANRNVIEQVYTEAYEAYTNGKYQEVIDKCNMVDTVYYKNFLMPKFDFLRALSIGRTQDIKAFESALTQITIKYPKDEVTPKAQEIIDFIKQQNTNSLKQDTTASKTSYIFDKNAEYYWVSVINGKNEISKFKVALSDLNSNFFGSAGLNINENFLDDNNRVVTVKNFTGKDKGMNYFDFVKDRKDLFKNLESSNYQSFIISSDNYSLLYKQKNVQEYLAFFQQNFLK